MDLNFVLAQIAGVLVVVTAVASMQFKDMKWVLLCQVISNVMTAANLALLGGFSGAGICIVATVQTLTVFLFNLKNKGFPVELSIIFASLYTVCSAIAYSSVFDIISAVAALIFAMSVVQKNSAICRIYMLINSLLWVVYDINIKAYSMLFTYAILITSIIIAMVRIDRGYWRSLFSKNK